MKLLLKCADEFLICDCDGNTLLHYAVKEGAKDMVILLLDMGMDINLNDKTPADIAAAESKEYLLKILLERGAEGDDV